MASRDLVRVFIRVRPLTSVEKDIGCVSHWTTTDNQIAQVNPSTQTVISNNAYTFDRVFNQDESNAEVYQETALPLVRSAVDGFNGTVFAYGQTSSGKTHTIMGAGKEIGIIFHAVQDLFNMIEETPERMFLLRVAYMEIYNEVVVDLLSGKTRLGVYENANGEVFVSGLHEEVITNVDEVYDVIATGEQRRHFAATDINEYSSRSHTIFRIIIESRRCEDGPANKEQSVLVSQLNIVDLAGAERAKSTTATGERLREGCAINRSLFMLSQVISKLSEHSALNATETSYIGFRDSKLTRILQPALGGNSKTAIICTITPAAREETLCTIKFAQRAKLITTKPIKNEVLNDRAMLKRYQKEIEALQRQVNVLTEESTFKALESEKDELNRKLREKEEKIRSLERLVCISTMSPRRSLLPKCNVNRRVSWCPGFSTRSPFSRLANNMIRPNPIPFQLPSTPKISFQSTIETLREEEESEEKITPDVQPNEATEGRPSNLVQVVDRDSQTDEWAPAELEKKEVSCLTEAVDFGVPLLPLFDTAVFDKVEHKWDFAVPETVHSLANRLEEMQGEREELDAMRGQLTLLLEEYNALKAQLSLAEDKGKSSGEHFAQQLDLKEKKNAELAELLDLKQKENDEFAHQLDVKEKKNEELQKEILKLGERYECLRSEKRTLENRLAETEGGQQEELRVLELQEHIETLTTNLADKDALLEELANQREGALRELAQQISEKEELSTVLTNQIRELETRIEDMNERTNQALAYEAELADSNRKASELSKRLEKVTDQCSTLSGENKTLTLAMANKNKEISLLNSEKTHLLNKLAHVEKELLSLNKREEQLAEGAVLSQELRERLEKLQAESVALSKENVRLMSKVADDEEEIKFLYAKLDAQDDEIARLERVNKDFEKRLDIQLHLLLENIRDD